MYKEVIEEIFASAEAKTNLFDSRGLAYFLHSAMAGAYVGLGIVLIFALGAPLSAAGSPFTPLIMGAAFGIALSLVIFAGSDLFTGNTMILPMAALAGRLPWRKVLQMLGVSYLGNLAGSALVAWLVYQAGTFSVNPGVGFITDVAGRKMHLDPWMLFCRGILCNWLVVLSIWSCYRMKSESGKLVMIFWCLLGFIGSGYEHSVANMTLLTLANLLAHSPVVSWSGMAYNLIPVTLGNITSGVLFMTAAYWYISPVHRPHTRPRSSRQATLPALVKAQGGSP